VGQTGEFLLKRIRTSVLSHTLHASARNVKILPVSSPGKIEVAGAAALIFTRHPAKNPAIIKLSTAKKPNAR
jgi:hypothetical protein